MDSLSFFSLCNQFWRPLLVKRWKAGFFALGLLFLKLEDLAIFIYSQYISYTSSFLMVCTRPQFIPLWTSEWSLDVSCKHVRSKDLDRNFGEILFGSLGWFMLILNPTMLRVNFDPVSVVGITLASLHTCHATLTLNVSSHLLQHALDRPQEE